MTAVKIVIATVTLSLLQSKAVTRNINPTLSADNSNQDKANLDLDCVCEGAKFYC